jgi:hypothetical protein
MHYTIKILSIILLLYGCASNRSIKESTEIDCPSQIGITENCENQTISKEIILTTNSTSPIKIYDFIGKPKIILNDIKVLNTDTLLLSKKQPIKFNVEIINNNLQERKNSFITFKTNHPVHKRKTIRFIPKTLILNTKIIQEGKDIIIEKTKECIDSLSIFFPYGGTISTVNLYKESQNRPFKSISYMMFENNKIDIDNINTGIYKLHFSSCHWANNLNIIVK